MADIMMCQRKDCPKAPTCYRFNATADPWWQSYFEPEHIPCTEYWPMEKKQCL